MEAAGIEPEVDDQQALRDHEVVSLATSLGVIWEDCGDAKCPFMSLDDRLLKIIGVWERLPENIKKEVETMCRDAGSLELHH